MRVGVPGKISDKLKKELYNFEFSIFKEKSMVESELLESYWWYAYHKGIAIGYSGLLYYPWLKEPAAFLYRTGVSKDYRGFGLQKRFIKVRERQALKDGYNRIISYTSYDNLASANSLISCGYKLYMPPTTWGVKNALYFQKYL